MQPPPPSHYATLGLDRQCTLAQIRAAYRVLARQHHPDLNPHSPEAVQRTQQLNAAYETLSNPVRRQAHDLELDAPKKSAPVRRDAKIQRHIALDVNIRLADFLHGVTREIHINDPANPAGPETYTLIVPPETAPGTRFRLLREGTFAGGHVQVRVKALPNYQFKVRGSDLRCDLKIKPARAAQGGTELIRSLIGQMLRVPIPKRAGRQQIIRIPGEGLPKPRGGRGDLLVRLTYRIPSATS